jgi:hypothetical protein
MIPTHLQHTRRISPVPMLLRPLVRSPPTRNVRMDRIKSFRQLVIVSFNLQLVILMQELTR